MGRGGLRDEAIHLGNAPETIPCTSTARCTTAAAKTGMITASGNQTTVNAVTSPRAKGATIIAHPRCTGSFNKYSG